MQDITIPYRSGRVVILADMHLDDYDRHGTNPIEEHDLEGVLSGDLDALIIAGDLINGPDDRWDRALRFLSEYVPPYNIYALPGNHDYYHGAIDDDPKLAKRAEAVGAHFIQKRVLRHGTTRFCAATLWVDFALRGNQSGGMVASALAMNDYRRIEEADPQVTKWFDKELANRPRRQITPYDVLMVHKDYRAWLKGALAAPHHAGSVGQTVVVTHHGPHIATAGALDALTASFHSDLSTLIEAHRPDAWFFGHSHRRLRKTVVSTDVRNVGVGYDGELRDDGSDYLVNACQWQSAPHA